MNTSYLGWSGFLLDDGETRIAIDPHWSSWTSPGELPPWDLTPLNGIVLSHGHGDHAGDVPELMRLHPKAWLAVGPGLRAWASELGLADRVHILPLEIETEIEGVKLLLLPGEHVGEGLLAQGRKLARYGLRRPISALELARQAFEGERGGTHAVHVQMPDGSTVLHAAEVLHRHTPAALWRRQVEGLEPQVLLLGVEPGEERAAATLATAVNAGSIRTFSPHAITRAHFGVRGDKVRWEDVEQPLFATRAEPVEIAAP